MVMANLVWHINEQENKFTIEYNPVFDQDGYIN